MLIASSRDSGQWAHGQVFVGKGGRYICVDHPLSLCIYTQFADPNLEDQYYPRSHQAASVRQVDFSEDLLPYRDYRDYTALHYAVIICNPTIVKMLLDHLADPLVRNSHGLTPREYLYYVERFTGEQNTEIEEMLHRKWDSMAV